MFSVMPSSSSLSSEPWAVSPTSPVVGGGTVGAGAAGKLATPTVFPPAPREIPIFANAAYYPNWRIYRKQPPSSLRLGFVSHVFYAFTWVKDTGEVYLSDEWADAQMPVDGTEGCLRAFTQLKRQYSELKVILSVGGGGKGSENFARVARKPQAVETFARTARALVDEYQLDGIDVDWEHPSDAQQGQDYLFLLSRLRAALPSPEYIITTALPAGEWALRYINLSLVQQYVDLILVMCYDFSGPWGSRTGHQSQLLSPPQLPSSTTVNDDDDNADDGGIDDAAHSPNTTTTTTTTDDNSDAATDPSGAAPGSSSSHSGDPISCHSAMTYFLSQGVLPRKLLLGIPVYGRSFLGATDVDQPYTAAGGEDGVFDYRDLPRPGAREAHDGAVVAAYCVGGDGGFVSYDTPRTVEQKAKFASSLGLGGLFYWHIAADKRGMQSLIETGYRTLHDM